MLSTLVLAAIIAAPLATIALFVHPARRGAFGAWPWTRRLASAVIGTLVLGAVVVGVLWAFGVTRGNLVAAAGAIALLSAVWMPVTRRWSAAGHLCWVAGQPTKRH